MKRIGWSWSAFVSAGIIAVGAIGCGSPDAWGTSRTPPVGASATVAPSTTASPASATAAITPPPTGTPRAGETVTPVPAQSADMGIEGQMFIGPTCPVERIDSPCPDRTYQAAVDIYHASSGALITLASSDADGRFSAMLDPGTYRLVPDSLGRFPHAGEQAVTVTAGQLTRVVIRFDSGIR